MKVDVVIPIYKPDQVFIDLMEGLKNQTYPIGEIILLNTEKSYFDFLVKDIDFFDRFKNVQLKHLSKQDFDHGGTRNLGMQLSKAEIVVMLTQDAVPYDKYLIENLVRGLEKNAKIGVAYGRQLPRKGANPVEAYLREFNYPSKSMIKSSSHSNKLGIKTYFCSNVCCAYKKNVYNELGGFPQPAIFNEDMIFASKVINAGYFIHYVAEARVIHSHNYSGFGQLQRNFDLGVSQAMHPEIFLEISSEKEGMKSVKKTLNYLCKQKQGKEIPNFIWHTACKYTGYILGKNYKKLPMKLVLLLTMNKEYWKNKK